MVARNRLVVRLAILVAACPFAAHAAGRDHADDGVTIRKAPPVIEYRVFDRRNPPPEMPPLERRTSAVTTMRYGCAAALRGPVLSRRRRGREYDVTVRVEGVEAKLDAKITVWLPRRARQIWVDHEEGHRVIAERAYELADEVARQEARKLVGRSVTGTGPSVSAAAEDALNRAAAEFMKAYQAGAHDWSKRVGDRYDEITDHSENQSVTVEDAIRQAFEDEPAPAVADDDFASGRRGARQRGR